MSGAPVVVQKRVRRYFIRAFDRLVANLQVGCSTCRRYKVKCDEVKPVCSKCHRLHRPCHWGSDIRHQAFGELHSSLAKEYMNHFFDHCSGFLIYPYDDRNPLQRLLQPLATSSTALLYSSAAIAARHLSRTKDQHGFDFSQHQHKTSAVHFYAWAVTELRLAIERSASPDAVLRACLLLCIYEVMPLTAVSPIPS